ncbi:MAG: hypothetical protein ACO3JG_10950 [Luteolibacter sp.]
MARPTDKPQASARSPFAGCAILIAALLVMVFLIVFSVVTLFRQYAEIEKFTAPFPGELAATVLEDHEQDLNSLAERIERFRQELAGDGDATLALDAEEMNLAIAAYEPFKDLRGTLRVAEVGDETLRLDVIFPLNGKPRLAREGEGGWITTDPRYLNATLVARPVLLSREPVLRIESIEVPGATVPKEFTEQMSPYRIAERYREHEAIGPAMAKLTRVELKDGKLVFARAAGETPADHISDEQVDRMSGWFFTVLGIAASLFLLFTGTVIFIGLRAKKHRKP